jgi:hypothetical protein
VRRRLVGPVDGLDEAAPLALGERARASEFASSSRTVNQL